MLIRAWFRRITSAIAVMIRSGQTLAAAYLRPHWPDDRACAVPMQRGSIQSRCAITWTGIRLVKFQHFSFRHFSFSISG
ncbi:MAG: hypothetical protein DMF03_11810 [Verrucomicrobia bacterium]|nr:MAG: hypothetical protein DMF03_11810 [Verrucomicrobiota bacterium]